MSGDIRRNLDPGKAKLSVSDQATLKDTGNVSSLKMSNMSLGRHKTLSRGKTSTL